MKLLVVTFDPPSTVGGLEARAIGYTRTLTSMGHFVELLALGPYPNFSTERFYGANLYRCPASVRTIRGVLALALERLKRSSIDSLFVLSGATTLLGVFLLLYAKLTGIRSAIFLYGKDILTAKSSPIHLLNLCASILVAHRIATNSRFTSTLLPKVFQRKVNILYAGADPQILSATKPSIMADGIKRLLTVGRLVRRKGAYDLIKVFPSILVKVPNALLEIVGDGPEKSNLHRLVTALGLQDKVRFYGALSGEQLYERYMRANIFVMPAKTSGTDVEGFGLVFLEAGLFGRPSVGTSTGGIPEAVVNGFTGLLVPENDLPSLEEALVKLLTDVHLADRLGRNARERILANFTLDVATKSLIEMFEAIQ